MGGMPEFGRFLAALGAVLVVAGLLLASGHLSWLGKLPGDLSVKREHFSFYFPWVTCLVVSILLTMLFSSFRK